jgi:hypothetical protein
MKRLVLLAMAFAAVALMVPAVASAATGDIERLEVDDTATVFDDGDKIAVDGDVECRVEDTWGIIMKAVGPDESQGEDDFQTFGEDNPDYDQEALGFGGPGSGNQGPVEQPCAEQGRSFDLVLEKLGTSDDFDDDANPYGLWALAASSPTQQADPAFLGDAEVFYGNVDLEQED